MRKLIARIIRRKPKPKADAAYLRMQIDGLTRDMLTAAYRARRIRERAGLEFTEDGR